jgi:hypothetical protein
MTGFGFPFHGFTPGLGVGVLSLVVLPAAVAGRYAFHLAGTWRVIYVVRSVMALRLGIGRAGLREDPHASCACAQWVRAALRN